MKAGISISSLNNRWLIPAIVILFSVYSAQAQREYDVCDSTFYALNTDTTVIAGKKILYLQTSAGVTQLADFTTPDTNKYIRDFDIIRPDLWYTLVGSRYIGSNTELYRSNDRGQSWVLDTSFFQATKYDTTNVDPTYYNSINQVQRMGTDTIALFVGYYHSGIVYSVDGGNTWHEWFRNMIVHYQGMLECDNYYFLYAIAGDGFQPVMFAFQKQLLFSSNSAGEWLNSGLTTYHPPCYNGNAPGCIFAPSNLTRCEQYNHFLDTLPEVCDQILSVINSDDFLLEITIYPNPAHDFIDVKVPVNSGGIKELVIYDYMGRRIRPVIVRMTSNSYRIDMSNYSAGLYTVVLSTAKGTSTNRLLLK